MSKRIGVALTVILAASAWGDTVFMKDGTTHQGTFLSGTSTTVVFRDKTGLRRTYPIRDVDRIAFGAVAASSDTTTRDRERRPQGDAQILPVGTELRVRTNEAINSDSAAEGRSYAAQLDADVLDSRGAVLIPRGSHVEMIVTQVNDPTKVREAELMLDLRSITYNGRRYVLETAALEQSSQEGIGKNRRTAEMVGGGAALGTVIGAIAGGGKGALLGAIIGAAGGGAAQVFTRGKKVEVPAETVLTFKLDQSVRLEPGSPSTQTR